MPRRLTSRSSLDNLKREAKRWLEALRENDPEARARLGRAVPDAPQAPTLRAVQHALAREHGFAGWKDLVREVGRTSGEALPASREEAIPALLAAAERGDADRVGRVLEAHPDVVNERAVLPPHTGRRGALHFALTGPHEDVVDVLLERGADPDLRDEGDNAAALHFAAERGDMALVRKLIDHGADPVGDGDLHELGILGWATCFEYALHLDVADYLLAHGAPHTIFTAVALGDGDAIRAVVAGDPTQLDRAMDATNRRRRPLHLAVVKNRLDSLTTLLDLGADVEATDGAGLTALDQAALSGAADIVRALLDRGARVGVPVAVALGLAHDLERLLAVDPDSLRPGGRWATLIVRAAERGPGSTIEALVRAGASVHVRDDPRTAVDRTHGYTALHAAAFHGNADAARALLRLGANPADREDRYWGTPAGWAAYAGHADVRDLVLEGPIDVFDAIAFDHTDRIPGIVARDPGSLERPLGHYVTGPDKTKPWADSAWTPLAWAVANGKHDAVRILLELGADREPRDSNGRTLLEIAREKGHHEIATLLEGAWPEPARPASTGAGDADARVADFLLLACGDWRVSGAQREAQARDAARILERHPGIARASIHTAVVCAAVDEVRRLLDERPGAVSEIGGPRRWPPILYLCSARPPDGPALDRSPETLRLLLERGADPNAFYLGGNADIHYTALTCVLGRGEEIGPMHPRAPELAAILLENGADPHDNQVLYNVFADNTSRHLLDEDIVWLLELMYEHSIRRGNQALWRDPLWPMFDMRGAPSLGDEERIHHGARFMLDAAVDRNLRGMAEWLLEHGADPNAPFGKLWPGRSRNTLYEDALARGHTEMAELLARYGAVRSEPPRSEVQSFVHACLAMDEAAVRSMLAEHPEYLQDQRALDAAVERDRADVVAMLLGLGVSPDQEAAHHEGRRPLHHAAAKGAVQAARVLIERGAEIDPAESIYGAPPIGWASYFNQTAMIELLGRYSRHVWTLTYRGLVERLRTVVEEDPERVRTTNGEGQTLLFWLPSDEDRAVEITRLLIEHGIDPDQRDTRGRTAADIARRRGLDAVVDVLEAARG